LPYQDADSLGDCARDQLHFRDCALKGGRTTDVFVRGSSARKLSRNLSKMGRAISSTMNTESTWESMPKELSPEAFLLEMARDLNGTLDDLVFNTINRLQRQRGGSPSVGEVIGIDILGPDNGAVILADLQPNYFVFQTIDSDTMGSHPENGSREFGFELLDSGAAGTKPRWLTKGPRDSARR
jgi:hypothetical protein